MDAAVPGLDVARFTTWFAGARRDLAGDLGGAVSASGVAGGKSNLTYELVAGARRWVVRRAPLGHVLATAHDMAREYRVMTALAETAVPVPRTVALCEDPDVTGAVTYVMEHVAGTPYRNAAQLAPLGPGRVHGIAEGLVDTLVDLHRVDPGAVGLADFGRPDGFLERQVRRWRTQMDGSLRREMPAAGTLHQMLLDRLPSSTGPGRIVHDDYRLDNVLVDAEDRPAAVIDWEMATLGDPLTDLAMLVIYCRIAGGDAVADAANAPGFLAEDEILDRYATRAGTALAGFGFYLGLAAFKLAAILEGIHVRFQQGQTVGAGFEGVGAVTAPLLDLGISSTKELD
ncbi:MULTISPECIES: phosphotransferase family protein [unclassified Nocardioides]|uniref:phosphotransferase family protein n=1 Tax=unclassified Nocardioides TaxID=2615069 RepID=UPI0002E9C753|nr:MULTISPECIES: phosphotransferase family protein [unclassified Nocardioides]